MKVKWLRNCLVTCVLGTLFYVVYESYFGIHFGGTFYKFVSSPVIEKSPYVKYALIWTRPSAEPIIFLGNGNETFHNRNCSYKNCYVVSNSALKVTEFDAIIFHGPEIMDADPYYYFPNRRSPHQSYIFTSIESSAYYKVPDVRYDGVFNFTWTYKLNSDINFGYMIVKDSNGNVIGPNITVPWMRIQDMLPINDSVKAKLSNKSVAAAWFVSNCKSHSQREVVAEMLIAELARYNMHVHVYGMCGNMTCPKDSMEECLEKIQRDYFFYFAFENSFSEDYVTEKLLHALQNYAVPVVYGAADYGRFMPDGIYLKATKNQTSVAELVKRMVELIKDEDKYFELFKWRNHYSYHTPSETPATDPFCSLCGFLNNIDSDQVSVVQNFYKWWNPH